MKLTRISFLLFCFSAVGLQLVFSQILFDGRTPGGRQKLPRQEISNHLNLYQTNFPDFVGFSYSQASRSPPSQRFIHFLKEVRAKKIFHAICNIMTPDGFLCPAEFECECQLPSQVWILRGDPRGSLCIPILISHGERSSGNVSKKSSILKVSF